MNRLGNLGILLVGIGILLWGLNGLVDSYIMIDDYHWEKGMIEQDWLDTERLQKNSS